MKKLLAILALWAIVFTGCEAQKWQGFYYPDGCMSCESQWIKSPVYTSKDQCLNWARDLKATRNNPSDDFECGRDCRPFLDQGNICKETVDN